MIPVSRPSITDAEMLAVRQTLADVRLTQGAGVLEFEQQFARKVGVGHAVACNSGTSALHLALLALGVGPGDEVLVPDMTYVATANAVTYCGARPVFVDSERETWGMDAEDARRKKTWRTRAVVAVHLYGVPCNLRALQTLELPIVEDAAEALGVLPCGTVGEAGCFSFYANKVITTGEGGMVVTGDQRLADRMRLLRGQGMDPAHRYYHPVVGYNYRMTDIAAALGKAQLARIDSLVGDRLRVSAYYASQAALESPQNDLPGPWLYTGLLPAGTSRQAVMEALQYLEIETRPTFVPMHRLPMYCGYDADYPVACELAERGLSLPTYPGMQGREVGIVQRLREVLEYVGNESIRGVP